MEPTAPVHAVKSGGKNIAARVKGHKPAVYIGVAIFGIVLAYYLHRRQQAQDAMPASPDTATVAPDASSSAYYPSDPSAGAGGSGAGFGSFDPGAFLGQPTAAANDGKFSAADIAALLSVYQPASGQSAINGDGGSILPVTGGGPAAPVDTAVVHTPPPPAKPAAPPAPSHAGFPFQGPHGWYKVVCASGKGDHAKGRWHFYQNGVELHVSSVC